MRLSYFVHLALVATVVAAPAAQEPAADITDITFVLEGYKFIIDNANKIVAHDSAIKSIEDVAPHLKEMSTLSASTRAMSEKMIQNIGSMQGKLSTQATLQIANPSAEVAIQTVAIIDNLVAKKDFFVQAGVHNLVTEDLNKIYAIASDFVDAARLKIPDQYTALANKYFQQLLDALQKGVQNFS